MEQGKIIPGFNYLYRDGKIYSLKTYKFLKQTKIYSLYKDKVRHSFTLNQIKNLVLTGEVRKYNKGFSLLSEEEKKQYFKKNRLNKALEKIKQKILLKRTQGIELYKI